MNKKFRNLNILANMLMIIGLVLIIIPIIYFVTGHGIIPGEVSLLGIVIGLVGVYISKKINKN